MISRKSLSACSSRARVLVAKVVENHDLLDAAIAEAISRKPKGHDFIIDRRHQRPALARHMSVTGG